MEKIDFKDYPDTTTPIDANNLNTMQDNVEASIIEVDTKNTNLKNQVANGWYEIDPTAVLTFSSWDASVYTGVVSTNIDLTSALSLGMKIKLTQNGVVKYGFITAITGSTMTLFMGTDYTLTNNTISDVFYSMLKAPYDFPMDKNKWTIEVKIEEILTQNNPINGGWYNIGNLNIQVPVGCWKLSYSSTALAVRQGTNIVDNWVIMTLSKTTNNETERDMTVALYNAIPSTNSVSVFDFVFLEKEINIETTTTYYLLMSTLRDGNSYLRTFGNSTPTIIRAICSYL